MNPDAGLVLVRRRLDSFALGQRIVSAVRWCAASASRIYHTPTEFDLRYYV